MSESFKEISQHLFDRPNSIEELTEQREYIDGIPEKVSENQVSIVCMYVYVNLVDKKSSIHAIIHTYAHTYARTHTHTHAHAHTHTHTHTHLCMYIA